ncbi:MAG: arabinosidase [Prevotella sp.]|nr:arabinosidase [Prevotella sp.]
MKTRTLLIAALACMSPAARAGFDITIDPAPTGIDISPMLYGIFFEDINHAADGGLYAELIRNRSFEDDADEPVAWSAYESQTGNVKINIETLDPLNEAQRQYLHVVTTGIEADAQAGVKNGGFWGIDAVKGREYKFSMWIKVKKGTVFTAMIKGQNTGETYASAPLDIDLKNKNWQHITASMTALANDTTACFVLAATGNADFCIDVVSLFPPTYKGKENGLRPDLAEMLEALHPCFMRFPGGCFVEGQDTPDNAFRWERTIGSIEERPGHENKNWGYRTTDGLGFHEYLQLAEDIGAKPLYVCNIGIWHGGVTPVEDIQPWVDECLNAIEYANGPVTSKYGALRAKYGHPAPFNLEYIEIGNENNQTDGAQTSDRYYERYRIFRDAILAEYPEMHIVGNVAAWGTDEPRWLSDLPAELVDEHYYRSPLWFASNFEKYDAYDRTRPKVYCGEYAVTQGFGDTGNLNAALGEAVYMMGMENNSDIVAMSSYAPIFVNINDARWMPDMIRFNNQSSIGTPSYYVQKLMSENLGDKVLNVTQGKQTLSPVNEEMTPIESRIGVATWKTQATFADITVTTDDGTFSVSGQDAADFTFLSDTWSAGVEGLSQTGTAGGLTALVNTPVKGRKYSVTMRAKKNSGDEGFILVFNATGEREYYWLTIGALHNSSHVLEQGVGFGRMTLKSTSGHVETGRWYDIRLDVDGNNITAYLDGEEILATTLSGVVMPGIFTSASLDSSGNEMIVKIVNTGAERETANLRLGSFRTQGGRLIQLKATDGKAENTLEVPTNVFPADRNISLDKDKPTFDIPPYSLNILRLKRE